MHIIKKSHGTALQLVVRLGPTFFVCQLAASRTRAAHLTKWQRARKRRPGAKSVYGVNTVSSVQPMEHPLNMAITCLRPRFQTRIRFLIITSRHLGNKFSR